MYALLVPLINNTDANYVFDFDNTVAKIISGHYHLWYLYVLIGIYISVPLLRQITRDDNSTKYFIIIILLLGTIPRFFITWNEFFKNTIGIFYNKMQLELFCGYINYFVIGHYLTYIDINKKSRALIYILGVLSLLFTIYITDYNSVNFGRADATWYNDLLLNTMCFSVAIFVFFRYNFSKLKLKKKFLILITKVSKLTFGIYLIYDFVNIILRRYGITSISYNSYLSVPLNSLCVFFSSLLITFILSKIPIVRKYMI